MSIADPQNAEEQAQHDLLVARAIADQEHRRKGGRHHRPSSPMAAGLSVQLDPWNPTDTRGLFEIPATGSSEGMATTQGDSSNTVVWPK